jgi:hypothetical protein
MRLLLAVLAGALLAVGAPHAAAPPLIRAEAQPATVGVGDTFSYLVEARFDADGLDASSVRIFADTGPFVQAGPTRTTHSTDGSAVVVRLEQRLTCLDLVCAPVQGLRRVRLPAARVTARHAGGRVTTGRAAPAVVGVEPRVSIAAVRAAPPPYRQQTELARALRLLRESATRPAPDRRRAADLVSRVVGAEGARPLANDAARFAWSAISPEPADAVGLAERAEGGAR